MALAICAKIIACIDTAITVSWSRTVVTVRDYRTTQNASSAICKVKIVLASYAIRLVPAVLTAIIHFAAPGTHDMG